MPQIAEYCIKNRRNLLLGGDVFNTVRPDAESVLELGKLVNTIFDAELRVMVIQGQHDYTEPAWPSAINRNIEHVEKTLFKPFDTELLAYGLDNRRDIHAVEAEIRAVPKNASILVVHQMFRDVFNMEGVWNIDTAWMSDNIKYVLAGDFHEPVGFQSGKQFVVYPGSTYMCKLDEIPAKSFCDIVEKDGELELTRIPLKSRKFVICNIATPEDVDKVRKYIEHELGNIDPAVYDTDLKPVVAVNYASTIQGVVTAMDAVCGDKAYMWPRPTTLRMTAMGTTEQVFSLEHKNMAGCLPLFKEQITTEAYSFVSDLIANPDTEQVLATYKEKYLGVTTK